MKVLLIQPQSHYPLMDQVFLFEPLALEYLAAGLIEDGHEVRIHDARLEKDTHGLIDNFRPDAVGMTAFTSQVNIVNKLALHIRTKYPETFLVIGGHHATVVPEDFNYSAFNAVVIGEGVFTLRALLSGAAIDTVAGVGIPSEGGMKFTASRPYTELDSLPMPARNLTAAHRGRYFSEWFSPLASVRTSLGCTARCSFCALWSVTGGKYLRRDPDRVVEEIRTVQEENIFFCDDESMCDAKRMSVLADRLEQAGIKKNYFLYARADTIVRHPDLFRKWAGVGLKQVFVGMEDFSDARLAAMKKGVTTDQQAQAVKILRDLNIMMYASFMVDPEYTKEDFAELKRYIRRLKLQYATFTVMTPLPGTELYKNRESELLSRKPELFDMLHSLFETRLPREEFYSEMAKLYKEAVPLYRSLPMLFRYGLHGMMHRLKLFGKFLVRVEQAHLDY